MATRTVTIQQIQHYLLTKHGLTQRLPSFDDTMLPLHATLNTTPYLSLLARVHQFGDGEGDAAGWNVLHKPSPPPSPSTSTAIPAYPHFSLRRCMRGTLHLIPRNLVDVIVSIYGEKGAAGDDEGAEKEATEEDAEEDMEDETKDEESEEEGDEDEGEAAEKEKESRILKFYKIPKDEAELVGEQIILAIKKHGPQSSVTLKKHLPTKLIKKREGGWGTVSNIGPILKYLNQTGRLEYGVAATVTGKKKTTWRNKVRFFGITTRKPVHMDKSEAMVALGKWYFNLYGPSSFEDFVWWTGLSTGICRAAFETLKADFTAVKADGITETLYIYNNHLDTLLQSPNKAPAMTRLLPYEDALIKAYKATRHRFFGTSPVTGIITRGGEARPTVWLDGEIVGVWKWTNKKGQDVTITLFNKETPEDSEEIEDSEGKEKKSKAKGKGKGKAKTSDAMEAIKKRLTDEIGVVTKFIEAENIVWV